MGFDDRQLFDLNGFIENHAAGAALFDDKDSRLGGQDETMIGPRVATDDFVVEIRIKALRLPRLLFIQQSSLISFHFNYYEKIFKK